MSLRCVFLCIYFALLLHDNSARGRSSRRLHREPSWTDDKRGHHDAATQGSSSTIYASQMGTIAEHDETNGEQEQTPEEEEEENEDRIDNQDYGIRNQNYDPVTDGDDDSSGNDQNDDGIPEVKVQTLRQFRGEIGRAGARRKKYDDRQSDFDSPKRKVADRLPYYQLFLDSPHRFNFLWSVDYEKERVLIEVHVRVDVDQWVAIGFSDYGQIENADFCVLWWDEWLNAHFQDAWTDSEGVLHLDKKQDCRLSRLQKQDDEVIFMYERDFDTCDDGQDYVLDSGTTHVIYASSEKPVDQLRGILMREVEHGFQRAQILKAVSKPAVFPKDTKTFAVLTDKARVPDDETTYWCRVVKLPAMKTRKHVIQFESVIQPGHESLVHHIEVYHCEIGKDQAAPSYDGPCMNSNKPPELDPCKKVIAAWAMGALPLVYPEEAGLPIGGPEFSPYAMLEIHYNNEERRDDFIDSSGVRFFFTSQLRRYDAGVVEIGLEYTPKMAIPPGQEAFTLSGDCIVECTEAALPPTGIVLFAAQLHTHLTGKQVVARHFRGGKELTEVAKDIHYSPHFQEIRILKKPVLVLPGDALVATCTYHTKDRENITLGGFAISDEMCVSYIHYYPKSYLEVCKSSIDSDVLARYFRFLNEYENQPTSPKKSVPENYKSVEWTTLRSEMLHQLYETTTLSMQCNMSSGDRFPGNWNDVPQTKILWPLPVPPRKCNDAGEFATDGESQL